jgi:phosphate transport system substrate-binding protein
MNLAIKRVALTLGLSVIALALSATQNSLTQAQQQKALLKIDGSSTVYPITQAAAKAFQQTRDGKSTQIAVAFSGTSGGFRKFCSGETDISNASRPILKKEMEACRKNQVAYIEIPVAFDALTVVVNPKNTWASSINLTELIKMWEPAAQGKIKTWQQVRASWPNRPLKLFGPGSDSGTFDYFTEAVMGKVDASRTDYVSSEDDEVIAKGVMNDPNAIGYFGYSYFAKHKDKLKPVAIDSGKGSVLPSPQTAQKNQYQPLSRPLFIYINLRSTQTKEGVRKFVNFYLDNAEKIVKGVNYIPLHPESYHQAKVHYYRGKVGTVFGGQQVQNLTLRELLRKQAQY